MKVQTRRDVERAGKESHVHVPAALGRFNKRPLYCASKMRGTGMQDEATYYDWNSAPVLRRLESGCIISMWLKLRPKILKLIQVDTKWHVAGVWALIPPALVGWTLSAVI